MRFVAYREDTGDVVAYNAVRKLVHQRKDVILGHRLVVLPEYQGLGIGCKFDDWLGEYLYRRGYIYRNVVVHPTMIAYYSRSPRWRLKHVNLRTTNTTSTNVRWYNDPKYSGRRTYTFEYVPGRLDDTIIHL
jgi:GNAT superfamily N-acetyltransferase